MRRGFHPVRIRTGAVLILLGLFLGTVGVAFPEDRQQRAGHGRGTVGAVEGRVVDGSSGSPLEYATVELLPMEGDRVVTGAVTRGDGKFRIDDVRPGIYRARVSFLGYGTRILEPVEVVGGGLRRLGTIRIEPVVLTIEEVEVEAERPAITYQIDKRVIDVRRLGVVEGGTVTDVLKNVPSVDVDVEGNVSLRGSQDFKVFVDGRPSLLEPSDALQQLPAAMVERIELVTNPSAKYDPEGVAGIINVITHKSMLEGVSGVAGLRLGDRDRYGGDFLVSVRPGRLGYFVGGNYDRRSFDGRRWSERWIARTDTTDYTMAEGTGGMGRLSYAVRAGVDWRRLRMESYGVTAEVGGYGMERTSDMDFTEWSVPGASDSSFSRNEGQWSRDGTRYSVTMEARKAFEEEGHEIQARAFFTRQTGDEESLTRVYEGTGDQVSGTRATERGPSRQWTAKIDYTRPVGPWGTIEAGGQGEFRRSRDVTAMSEWDRVTEKYENLPAYENTTDYAREVYAIYLLQRGKWKRLGFQGGIRAERTDRSIATGAASTIHAVERWDRFLTLHASIEMSSSQEWMASYTQRIQRPRGWYLEPFVTYMDDRNARVGNPDLLPEYIDSYELGYHWSHGDRSITAEGYHRIVSNVVERVQTLAPDSLGSGVTLHTYENAGSEWATGGEVAANWRTRTDRSFGISASVHRQRVGGELFGRGFRRSGIAWQVQGRVEYGLPGEVLGQIRYRYVSSRVTAQGRRAAFSVMDIGVRRSWSGRRWTGSLEIGDVVGTATREFETSGVGFHDESVFQREPRRVTLSLTYNFNDFRPSDRRGGERGGNGEVEEEF